MMIYRTKSKIGEFSKLMQTTMKTLRHYEQKGLLLPHEVVEWTGYRYIEEQGYRVVGQHRTCYIDGAWNQKEPEKWLSLIQIPIE